MSDFPDLTAPWSSVPLVHEDTKLFPAPTMDALSATFAKPVGTTIALFGHSIVAYNDLQITPGSPNRQSTRSDGWFWWLNTFLYQRFTLAGIFGFGGYTVAQLKDETAAPKATGASYVMIQALTNSINANYSDGATVAESVILAKAAEIIADLDIIVADFLSNGQRVILTTEWPSEAWTSKQKILVRRINDWIVDQSARDGVIVVPWHHALTDPSDGTPVTNALADGTHPSSLGAMRAAWFASQILDPLIPSIRDGRASAYNGEPNNALTNGMMYGTGGSITGAGTGTGSVATGYELQVPTLHTAVASKVSLGPDALGDFTEWQKVYVSYGTNSSNNGVQLVAQVSLPSGWVAGTDEVFGEWEISVDADFVKACSLELSVWSLTGGFSIIRIDDALRTQNGTTDIYRIGPWTGLLRTEPFTIPATTGMFQMRLRVNIRDNTGAERATFYVRRARIARVQS